MIQLHHGDCLDVLRTMPDASVDAIVTDPPYGLRFMGKKWDYDVPTVEVWAECLRVLKPGGHLLAFAGTRTQHRMAVRIEDAGFEIRDMIAWVYGCLSEDTEILVEGRWEHFHKAIDGKRVLCYIPEHDKYEWQRVQETIEYDYEDTAFHICGDRTDQIVSRNHRCLVERGGGYAFQLAETLERQARVPVLESVQDLLETVPLPHEGTGNAQSELPDMRDRDGREVEQGARQADDGTQGADGCLPELRERNVEAGCLAEEKQAGVLFPALPSRSRDGSDSCCQQVQPDGDEVSRYGIERREQPGMEGWCDLFQTEGQVCEPSDQVCPMPEGVLDHGKKGRLRDGAPAQGRQGDRQAADEDGVRSPCESRRDGQQAGEPGVVCEQQGSQALRASRFTRSDLAHVTPVHYKGKVWCVRVPSGAFVARRNGKVFVTGNSGFPKSLDVSKAIDKAAGAEREVVGMGAARCEFLSRGEPCRGHGDNNGRYGETIHTPETVPSTASAAAWQGWGTALKPALEPVTVARKPLEGTVAANVLRWGTGGMNVDGARVRDGSESGQEKPPYVANRQNLVYGVGMGGGAWENTTGRWPANLIHSGEDEVVGLFPGAGKESAARFFYTAKTSKADREYGLDRQRIVYVSCPLWENEDHKAKLRVDMGLSRPRVIAVSGAPCNDATVWSTFLFGSDTTAPYLTATKSTTETVTSSTTEWTTSNSFRLWLTSGCTEDANGEVENGGSRVASAGRGTPSITITSAWTVSVRGVERASSPTPFTISAGGSPADHPTVKPVDLMCYLCRLVTPPGGIVLDPFMGSGSTGKACVTEGFSFIGIERDADSFATAQARVVSPMPLFKDVL